MFDSVETGGKQIEFTSLNIQLITSAPVKSMFADTRTRKQVTSTMHGFGHSGGSQNGGSGPPWRSEKKVTKKQIKLHC